MANDISIVPFKFKYLPLVIEMHRERKYMHMAEISMKMLPKVGYIALLGKHPVAAGFLRRVEGGFAQFDTFVSNPFFGSQIRHEGMSLVVNSLIEEAKALKLRGIIAFTEDQGIFERAEAQEFQVVNQVILTKSLSKTQ